jgi:GDPmannose 4,6-dehydratase
MPKALICGISGQDGSYLAKLLLSKGYEVFGTSRDAMASSFNGLHKLGIFDQVNKLSMAINDFRSVFNVIQQCEPDEIYNLAGQTSVALSFQQPVEAMESIAGGTLNLLEVIRLLNCEIKLYNAGSSEFFGDTGNIPADESTTLNPVSPYGVAKAAAYWLSNTYKTSYDLYVSTGILFNHESTFRPARFVSKKIISAAKRIAQGSKEKLELGRLDMYRDWGWAPEYVEAMWLMLQQAEPDDFVIATGKSFKLEDFVNEAFRQVELNWNDHVVINPNLSRPSEIAYSSANPEKANMILGWKAKLDLSDIVYNMHNEII